MDAGYTEDLDDDGDGVLDSDDVFPLSRYATSDSDGDGAPDELINLDPEVVVAPFTQGGAATERSYSGLIRVDIAGFGEGTRGSVNEDAFYVFTDPNRNPVTPYYESHLVGFDREISRQVGEDHLASVTVFVDGAGFSDPTDCCLNPPAFSDDHQYSIVISYEHLGGLNGPLQMGTYDTGLDDNAGEFVFTLTPVRQIADPNSSTSIDDVYAPDYSGVMLDDLIVDAFPDDPSEWLDSDGDGYGDNKDAYPFDPERAGDLDGDGFVDQEDAFSGAHY